MREIICFAKTERLQDIINGLNNEKGFCELESPSQIKFIRFPSGEKYETFLRGFIFNEDFELKWLKMEDHFHVVFTGKKEKLPACIEWEGKKDLIKEKENEIYLWEIGEKRVNKHLTYPVEGGRVKILISVLREKNGSYVKRFTKLEVEDES